MPFERIYFVNFTGGNLGYGVNKYGWDWMKFSPHTPDNQTEWVYQEQPIFRVTRNPPDPPTPENPNPPPRPHARCSLFVETPGLALSSRLRMRLVFSRPMGEGFGTDGQLYPVDGLSSPPDITRPEPWAVGLNVFTEVPNVQPDNSYMVKVTCQFFRVQQTVGIKLNTPDNLEGDASAELVRPIKYPLLQSGGHLILEHSFCGVGAGDNHQYVVGNCHLKYHPFEPFSQPPFLEDQRLYSSKIFQDASNPSIAALGVTLVTQEGAGRISVCPASFEVLERLP